LWPGPPANGGIGSGHSTAVAFADRPAGPVKPIGEMTLAVRPPKRNIMPLSNMTNGFVGDWGAFTVLSLAS
jgi:hypothetical protein